MHLYAKKTGKPPVDGIVIRNITHQDPIDEVLQMIAVCNDPVFIPVIFFDSCLEDGGISQGPGHDLWRPLVVPDMRL